MVVNERHQFIGTLIDTVIVQHPFHLMEAARLLARKAKADAITETEIKNGHADVVGVINRPLLPRLAEAILTKHEQPWLVSLHGCGEFLPEPDRHVFERVNAQGIDTGIKPHLNCRLDVIAIMNIFFIKCCQPHHLKMDQLIFIFPISNFTFMVVKTIVIMVEISQGLTIIQHDTLASIDIRRTMVANNIQHNLDTSRMTGIHKSLEGWRLRNAG